MPRPTRRRWFLACLALVAPAGASAQAAPVEITFLDVGQGDAILIRAPEGQTALIDAGPSGDVVRALVDLGIDRLDLVVATHPHADHIGGMRQVLEQMPVRFYMDNGQPHTTATYRGVMSALQSRPGIGYLEAVPRTITLGSVRVRVLPLPERPSSNLNDHSVGLVVEHGAFRAFLSGDSEEPELLHFLAARPVPDVTLLKAPHHGSDDAASEAFLEVARPEVVVISAGRGNGFGHPHASALHIYAAYADEIWRTDVHGPVTALGFEDGSYEVTAGARVTAGTGGGTVGPPGPEPEEVEAAISISVFADAPGNDHQNTNGEYAILSNASSRPIDLSGWTLCDAARHCYTFPQAASLGGGGRVVLYTGRGASGGAQFFMGSGQAVWNNDGDTATLYDPEGRVVARHVY